MISLAGALLAPGVLLLWESAAGERDTADLWIAGIILLLSLAPVLSLVVLFPSRASSRTSHRMARLVAGVGVAAFVVGLLIATGRGRLFLVLIASPIPFASWLGYEMVRAYRGLPVLFMKQRLWVCVLSAVVWSAVVLFVWESKVDSFTGLIIASICLTLTCVASIPPLVSLDQTARRAWRWVPYVTIMYTYAAIYLHLLIVLTLVISAS